MPLKKRHMDAFFFVSRVFPEFLTPNYDKLPTEAFRQQ